MLAILLAVALGTLVLGALLMPHGAFETLATMVGPAAILIFLGLVQLPISVFFLAVLRGQRLLLSDRIRLAATVSGVAVIAYGWIVAGSGVRGAMLVGAAIIALGAAALPAALVPPRVRTPDIGARLLVLILPLALVLLGKIPHAYDAAYLAQMKSDLRNYVVFQERRDSAGSGAAALRDTVFRWSDAVQVLEASAESGRVVARVSHRYLEGSACAIFVGTASVPPALAEGEPRCTSGPGKSEAQFFAGLFYLGAAALVTALAAWRLAAAGRGAAPPGDIA